MKSAPATKTILFDRNDVVRLTLAHIRAFQDRRISQGRVSPDLSLDCVVAKGSENTLETFALDEATFGIDSLSLLDLVMEVARFFNLPDSGVEDYLFIHRRVGDWVDLISDHFARVGEDARLTFQTSGSTGTPKGVVKTYAELSEEVAILADHAAMLQPKAGRVVSAVAPQHIYGTIWSVILPRRMGRSVLDRYKSSPLLTAKTSQPGDIILATPYLWEKFAEYGAQFSPECLGVSSGGPTTAATYAAAAATGLDRLVEVYGSSETGGVGLRASEAENFRLLDHLARADFNVLRAKDDQPLDIQDHLSWTDATHFKVEGRLDQMVQIAGTNVDLTEVESLISGTAGVDKVCVRSDGTRIKAFVVPDKASPLVTEREIRDALQTLPAVARPEQITFGTTLPVTDTGKAANW